MQCAISFALPLSDDDDSEDESVLELQPYLIDEMGLVEGALLEQTFDNQLAVKVRVVAYVAG